MGFKKWLKQVFCAHPGGQQKQRVEVFMDEHRVDHVTECTLCGDVRRRSRPMDWSDVVPDDQGGELFEPAPVPPEKDSRFPDATSVVEQRDRVSPVSVERLADWMLTTFGDVASSYLNSPPFLLRFTKDQAVDVLDKSRRSHGVDAETIADVERDIIRMENWGLSRKWCFATSPMGRAALLACQKLEASGYLAVALYEPTLPPAEKGPKWDINALAASERPLGLLVGSRGEARDGVIDGVQALPKGVWTSGSWSGIRGSGVLRKTMADCLDWYPRFYEVGPEKGDLYLLVHAWTKKD